MNKLEEKKIELVETLMEHHSFEELSNAEQAIVLEVVETSSEYNEMKEVNEQLFNIKRREQNMPSPNPQILKTLQDNYFHDQIDASKPKTKTKNLFARKLSFPVYQLGAAAIILLALFFTLRKPASINEQPPIVREVFVRDSIKVFQPKDTVFIEKVIYQKSATSSENLVDLDEKIETLETDDAVKSVEYLDRINSQKGFSLQEKQYLLSLNVGAE